MKDCHILPIASRRVIEFVKTANGSANDSHTLSRELVFGIQKVSVFYHQATIVMLGQSHFSRHIVVTGNLFHWPISLGNATG
jgi:hypothetical protein